MIDRIKVSKVEAYWLSSLTMSDTDFFEPQKYRECAFWSFHPDFCSIAAVLFKPAL